MYRSDPQPRIKLLEGRQSIVPLPSIAVGPNAVQRNSLRDVLDALEELDAQSLGHVPGDVAVEKPRSGVVGAAERLASTGTQTSRNWEGTGNIPEGHDEPAISREHRRITACRVRKLEAGAVSSIGVAAGADAEGIGEGGGAAENEEVVAVKMHGVLNQFS